MSSRLVMVRGILLVTQGSTGKMGAGVKEFELKEGFI